MIKKIKKGISFALALAMMIPTALPIHAATQPKGIYGNGSSLVALVDDPTTDLSWDADAAGRFETPNADGRIWVDKSVEDNGTGTFDVKLKTLTQEYISTKTGAAQNSVTADVVFVLDGSGSMIEKDVIDSKNPNDETAKLYRIKAMIEATNEAIGIILNANPKNRVAVYMYGNAVSGLTSLPPNNQGELGGLAELLPLDSYTLGEQIDVTSTAGKYLIWGTDYTTLDVTKGYININSTLKNSKGNLVAPKVGSTPYWLNSLHYAATGATPTQQGVAFAVNQTTAKINDETKDTNLEKNERIPFMFLLSDGGATYGYTDWWNNPNGTATRIGTGGEAVNNAADRENLKLDEITASTILSNAKKKSEFTEAYNGYNTAAGFPNHNTRFYTLGLGNEIETDYTKSDAGSDSLNDKNSLRYAWLGIEPLAMERAIADTTNQKYSDAKREAASKLKIRIAEYVAKAEAEKKDPDADYLKYLNEDVYNYSDVYGLANTTEALGGVFDQLANEVASLTKTVMPPVDPDPQDPNTTITFSDKIGAGMQVVGKPSIKIDGSASVVGEVVTDDANSTVYKFKDLKGLVTVYKTNNVSTHVEWKLSVEDLKSCTILISENAGNVTYNSKLPLELTYPVGLVDSVAASGETYYTNSFVDNNGNIEAEALAYFSPSVNNPYYYFTNKSAGSIGTLTDIGYKNGDDISHYLKGDAIIANIDDDFRNLTNVYITSAMNAADSISFPIETVGTVMAKKPDTLVLTDEIKTAISGSIQNCAEATNDQDTSSTFAFKVGIPKEHKHFLNKADKGSNSSGTAEYVWIEEFVNGRLLLLLGNNAKLNFVASIEKAVDKDEAQIGDTLTYTIKVTNHTASELTGLTVVDTLPANLTITDVGTGTANNNVVTWNNLSVDANDSKELTLKVTVDATAVVGENFENVAKITEHNGVTIDTPVTSDKAVTTVIATPKTITLNVEKDDANWADHNKTFVLVDALDNVYETDDPLLPEGEYTIYEGTKASPTTNTNTKITIDSNGGTANIDYYTLVLNTTSGITSTTGAGVYPKDTVVNIDAVIEADSEFVNWTGNAQTIGNANLAANSVKVITTTTLTANAKEKLHSITANITKNGAPYTDDVGLVWTDAQGNVVADINAVPNGTYTYTVNDGNGGTSTSNVVVNGNNETVNIKYFTLEVNKDSGIDIVSGAGTYLKGTSISINATPEAGYNFDKWTGDTTTGDVTASANTIVIDSSKVVTATSKLIPTYTATIIPQLDGGLYPDLPNFDYSGFTVQKKDTTDTPVALGNNGTVTLESGDYTLLYNSNPLPTNVEFTINAADQDVRVDYFTLALEHDWGIESVTADGKNLVNDTGIYLAGTKVVAAYTLKNIQDNTFEGWEITDGSIVTKAEPIEIIMNQKQHYVATSSAKETTYYKIPVLVNLDDNEYATYDMSKVSVKKDGVSYHAVKDTADNKWYIKMPEGVYDIYANGVKTNTTIDIANSETGNVDKQVVVDYYTLTVGTAQGDLGVDTTMGSGVYLKGVTADITVTTHKQYSFEKWTGDIGNVTNTSAPTTTVVMSGKTNLFANTTKDHHTVTVNVNLNDETYTDFTTDYPGEQSKITLVDNNDPTKIYETADDIPNGTYTVYIGGEATYQNNIVLDHASLNPTVTIDYYGLTLQKTAGISDTLKINDIEKTTGTFLKGAIVTIEATTEDKYRFEDWNVIIGNTPTTVTNAKTAVTITEKTELEATATPLFSLNSVIHVNGTPTTVNIPTVVWKDANNNIVGDPTGVVAGKYTLHVDDGTGNIYTKEVEVTNADITETLNYFTLETKVGDGIHATTGTGTYLTGTSVEISATAKDGYTFENNWTVNEGVTPVYDDVSKVTTVTMDEKTIVTAVGTERLYNIDISATLNDTEPYSPSNKVEIKDNTGSVITDLSKVPAGDYTMWVDDKEYSTVKVEKDDVNVLLSYYTLEVKGDKGITSTSGSGNYLKGTQVDISAEVKKDYAFVSWTGAQNPPDAASSKFTVNEKTTLTANTTNTFFQVTVDAKKDSKEYTDFDGDVTLKDKEGNIITDLNKVPNGEYIVVVDQKETNIKVVVDDGDANIELEYFTLTLEKGDGISSTTGGGIYLKGTEISIDALVKDGFSFTGWTGDMEFDKSKNTVVINDTLLLTAHATKTSNPPPAPDVKPIIPGTGDSTNAIALLMALLSLSVFTFAIIAKKHKKTR